MGSDSLNARMHGADLQPPRHMRWCPVVTRWPTPDRPARLGVGGNPLYSAGCAGMCSSSVCFAVPGMAIISLGGTESPCLGMRPCPPPFPPSTMGLYFTGDHGATHHRAGKAAVAAHQAVLLRRHSGGPPRCSRPARRRRRRAAGLPEHPGPSGVHAGCGAVQGGSRGGGLPRYGSPLRARSCQGQLPG